MVRRKESKVGIFRPPMLKKNTDQYPVPRLRVVGADCGSPVEQALDFIDTDELLEVTPESLRIRKRILDPTMRKRASIAKKNAMK